MTDGSAATVAGFPAGWLWNRMIGCSWLAPASARLRMRSTQDTAPLPAAFQSSGSTDQFQTCMWRWCARASVVASKAP